MITGLACALLALAAWIVYASGGSGVALVFAIVWTSMAVAYGGRRLVARRPRI